MTGETGGTQHTSPFALEDEGRRKEFIDHLQDGLTIEEVCDLVGIGSSSYYRAQARAKTEPEWSPALTHFFEVEVRRAKNIRHATAQRIITSGLRAIKVIGKDSTGKDITVPDEGVRRATARFVIQCEQRERHHTEGARIRLGDDDDHERDAFAKVIQGNPDARRQLSDILRTAAMERRALSEDPT